MSYGLVYRTKPPRIPKTLWPYLSNDDDKYRTNFISSTIIPVEESAEKETEYLINEVEKLSHTLPLARTLLTTSDSQSIYSSHPVQSASVHKKYGVRQENQGYLFRSPHTSSRSKSPPSSIQTLETDPSQGLAHEYPVHSVDNMVAESSQRKRHKNKKSHNKQKDYENKGGSKSARKKYGGKGNVLKIGTKNHKTKKSKKEKKAKYKGSEKENHKRGSYKKGQDSYSNKKGKFLKELSKVHKGDYGKATQKEKHKKKKGFNDKYKLDKEDEVHEFWQKNEEDGEYHTEGKVKKFGHKEEKSKKKGKHKKSNKKHSKKSSKGLKKKTTKKSKKKKYKSKKM